MQPMNVLVIDGQGGGLGKQLVAALSTQCPEARLTAVGTNSLAANAMRKAGAPRAATGENAVAVNCRSADISVGPIGIVIADALLGAAGLPDIGYWFPPGDPACKDIPSLDIVAKAVSLIRERGGRIVNVDSSLIAESPRISPYLEQMKGALGTALGISPVRVGIKATTNEQLGALGRREGIAAFAVAAILMPEDLAMP